MQKYIVANVREDTFLLFTRSPLSTRPTFYWEDEKSASQFTFTEAQAACTLLAFIAGSVSNLSIEEARQ